MNFQATNVSIKTFVITTSNNFGIPMGFDNVEFSKDTGLWGKYNFIPNDNEQGSIGSPGNNVHRLTGIVLIQLFDEYGKGDKLLLTKADEIAAAFVAVGQVGSVNFHTPKPGRVGRAGKWWQLNVTVPFYADVLA